MSNHMEPFAVIGLLVGLDFFHQKSDRQRQGADVDLIHILSPTDSRNPFKTERVIGSPGSAVALPPCVTTSRSFRFGANCATSGQAFRPSSDTV